MKVMDPKRWAQLCAGRFIGDDDDSLRRFGGTTSLEAELDDETIDGLKMRKALERFGRALVAQYDSTVAGSRIIGVNLQNISFSFITVPNRTARDD